MSATPLLTKEQWGIFGGFVLALFGISFISPKIASVVGVGVITVIVIQNGVSLGIEKTS